MAQQLFWKSLMSGGTDGAIDSIDPTIDSLVDGDRCIVINTTYGLCSYIYDDDNGTAEDIPLYIAPDLDNGGAYAGDGRWVLETHTSVGAYLYGGALLLDADEDTWIRANTDDQIDIYVAGALDFQIIANTLKILSGSVLSIESGASLKMGGEELYLDADSDTYLLADVDDIVQMFIGGTDYGNLKPPPTFVIEANGKPIYSATTFSVSTNVTKGSWESVGPTASGASNIWTALDGIPTVADWIEIRLDFNSSAGAVSTELYVNVYAREGGSSATVAADTRIGYGGVLSDGSGDGIAAGMCTAKIPISSSNIFDIYYSSTFTADLIIIAIVGWGYNSD